MSKATEPLKIEDGMELVCDTLSWDDSWEFEHPSMMLSPVIRCYESGLNHEQIVEGVLIDAVVELSLESEDFEKAWAWRGYKLPVLRRRFKEAMAGKRFPVAGYCALRTIVRIVKDVDDSGCLTWLKVERSDQNLLPK